MADQAKQSSAAPQPSAIELTDFESLLSKEFKPKSDNASTAIKNAVQTLAAQALADTAKIPGDAIKAIEEIIRELDRKLSEQINLILHHEDFKALEGT
jgi:type VI secretion system protein ImpC